MLATYLPGGSRAADLHIADHRGQNKRSRSFGNPDTSANGGESITPSCPSNRLPCALTQGGVEVNEVKQTKRAIQRRTSERTFTNVQNLGQGRQQGNTSPIAPVGGQGSVCNVLQTANPQRYCDGQPAAPTARRQTQLNTESADLNCERSSGDRATEMPKFDKVPRSKLTTTTSAVGQNFGAGEAHRAHAGNEEDNIPVQEVAEWFLSAPWHWGAKERKRRGRLRFSAQTTTVATLHRTEAVIEESRMRIQRRR